MVESILLTILIICGVLCMLGGFICSLIHVYFDKPFIGFVFLMLLGSGFLIIGGLLK